MESAYASTFLTTVDPLQAATILRDRVTSNRAIADDLAEWFRELQGIEQAYCRSLGKLAARIPMTDIANMGVMEKPWRRTVDGLNTLATNHSKFATKLTQDLIQPLSQYDKTPENGNMGLLERNLSQISKDLESAEAKVQKAVQSKSKNKSSKQTDAQEDVRKCRGRWDSESPNTFEKLQQVDEARVAFLKDALLKYESSSIDLCNAQIKSSETAIAQLLDISPTDEPMDFVSKRLSQSSAAPGISRPAAPGLSRTLSQGDSGSVRSSGGGAASSLKSKFGTLLKGRNAGSPNKRQSMMPSFGSSSNSVGNRQKLPEMREEAESPRPNTQATGTTGLSLGSTVERTEPSDVTSQRSPPTMASQANQLFDQNSRSETTPVVSSGVVSPSLPTNFTTERYNSHEGNDTAHLQNSLRGVSIRSDSYSNTTREEDEAAMDKVASTLRAQPTVSRRSRGRRDIRNSVFSSSQNEASQVVSDVLGSPLSRPDEPQYPVQSSALASTQVPAVLSNRASILSRQDTAMSYDGADSIRSSRSNSSALPSNRHVEPTTDGLHLSVIETVNVVVGIEGALSNFSVLGEAAVANRSPQDLSVLQLQVQSPDTISRLVVNNHILRSTGPSTYELEADSTPNMATLFKYQVQPDANRQARFMPILLSQKWSTEENQTSVKLGYRLNPLFGAGSLTLQDVEVSVSITGSANSCVAKPSGTFVKKSNKLVWRLNEMTLESGTEGVLLARFKTNSASTPSEFTEIKFKTLSSNIARGSGFGIYATRSKNNPFADSPTIENVMVEPSYVLQSGHFMVSTKSN